MTFIYTQANLKTRINAKIQGKIGMLVDEQGTMNEAVRTLFRDVDLRSARRRATLTPNLYNGIFDYTCQTDLKAYSIIDIPAQAARQDGSFYLVPAEEFEVGPRQPGMIAIDDFNGTRVLKICSQVNSQSLTVSELDSTTSGGGTWALFGDATTVAADTDDFIKGAGSLKWNISAAGGTTAGIQNASVNAVDMTEYFGGTSSFFVWHKINSTTNITNYILRFGTDSSNYYSKTITTQADGTAFVAGWNLLKFDVASYSTTGTPTDTNITYFVIYMTKTAGKISETDYKFDWLVLKRGVVHNTKYYSKYGWTNNTGTYIENSTATTDLLVADTDEFDLIVEQGTVLAAQEVDIPYETVKAMKQDLALNIEKYMRKNPSEAKIMTSEYYRY